MRDKTQRPSPRVWTRVGCTKKGRDIYRSILGNYAVERDHRYLVGPTEEEKLEIKRLDWLARKEKPPGHTAIPAGLPLRFSEIETK
jgi:hypothetical protein